MNVSANSYTPGEVLAEDEKSDRLALGLLLWEHPVIVGPTTPFDGGIQTYKRSYVAFRSGARMTRANAVFVAQAGGTLSNMIIAGGGGVFCELHNCPLFRDSVQGAIHVNAGTGITTITGGGDRNVARRITFGQGSGTVVISGDFLMINSGRLFESCGTCGPVKRGIIVDGAVSVNPTAELIRVNSNYNDRGTVSRSTITTTNANYPICSRFNGGIPAEQIGFGADPPVWSFSRSTVRIWPDARS
ncbi:hypothetical protein PsorP6_018326 [Peronosclerospora sorghi]|nr:hypothetical protein PsorP6_018345 [Peronosclerospora sorghi]KAI9895453.1 hypothetical protein PsorP6_018326 [Peronosclerospora sorghi]